jgi:hypothetical protein
VRKGFYILGILSLYFTTVMLLPVSAAQVVQLVPSNCHDATKDLRFGMGGSKGASSTTDILWVQSALVKEGFPVRQEQLGTFGVDTFLAVIGFQEKYEADILIPAGLAKGNGFVGPLTRNKLNSLYGCEAVLSAPVDINRVILDIQGVLLDASGISVTFCNDSPEDIPTFPIRIRINGILRDFDIKSALHAKTCYPARWSYQTWGLSYDPETLYTVVVLIDPLGYYKKSALLYPDLEAITLPAVQGTNPSVRSLLFKNGVVQATFCNLGTKDVSNFSVHAILNGVEKDFDITGAHKSGTCASVNWPFANWQITYSPGTGYTAVVIVNNNPNASGTDDFGTFSNAAAASGVL